MYIIFTTPGILIVFILLFFLGAIGQGATAISGFAFKIAAHWKILLLTSMIINILIAFKLSLNEEIVINPKGEKRNYFCLLMQLLLGVTMYNSPSWLFIFGIFVPFAESVDGIIDSIIFIIWMLISGSISTLIWGYGYKFSSESLEKNSMMEYVLFGIMVFWISLIIIFIFNLGHISWILGPYLSDAEIENILKLFK